MTCVWLWGIFFIILFNRLMYDDLFVKKKLLVGFWLNLIRFLVRFMRYSQSFINRPKNSYAMIQCNNSFNIEDYFYWPNIPEIHPNIYLDLLFTDTFNLKLTTSFAIDIILILVDTVDTVDYLILFIFLPTFTKSFSHFISCEV